MGKLTQTISGVTVNNLAAFGNVNGDIIDSGVSAAALAGGSGTVTSVAVASANGFTGTVAHSTTAASITMATSVTGLLKGNGTAISAAAAGTDYVAPSTTVNGHALSSNVVISATDINTGTLPAAQLPLATSSSFGAVEPDNTTITISGGVISAVGGGSSSYTSASVTYASPVSIPLNNTATDICSLSLAAGTYDITAVFGTEPGASTPTTQIGCWTSTTSATAPTPLANSMLYINQDYSGTVTQGITQIMALGTRRVTFGSPVTLYLSAAVTFSGTMAGFGFLEARGV